MNIGDLFLRGRYDGSNLEHEITDQATRAAKNAGAKAGVSLGTALATGLTSKGKALESIGSSMSRNVTLPVVAAGAAIVATGVQFDTTMRQIVALTDVTADEIGGVESRILDLATALGKSPEELAQGFYFLASAGFDTSEAMKVLESTAKASATGLGTTADVSKVVGAAINAFGKENLTAEDAVDQLIRAVKDGSAEAPEFAASLGDVVGSAGQLGATFADTSAAIAAMTLKGISAAEASTSLNNVFLGLIKTTPQAEEGFKAVGLSSEGLRKQLREKGLLSVLQTLGTAFAGSDTAAAAAFGSIRALRGILALTGGDAASTAAIFEDVATGTTNLGDAFEETEGPGRAIDRALAEVQVTLIELSDDVLPVFVEVLKGAAGVLKTVAGIFHSLPDPVRSGVVQILALTAALGPLLFLTGKVAKGLGSIVGVFGKIADKVGLRMMERVAEEVGSDAAAKVIGNAAGDAVGEGLTSAGRSSGVLSAARGLGLAAGAAIGLGLAAAIAVLAVAKMVADQVAAEKEKLAGIVSEAIETQTIEELERSAKVIQDQVDSMKILGVVDFQLAGERSGPNGLDAQLARLRQKIEDGHRQAAIAGAVAFREGERYDGGVPHLVADEMTGAVAALNAALPKLNAASRAAGATIPDSVAAGVLAEQDAPVQALDTLKNLMKNALTPAQDIARNIGILTSKELAAGLADKRPAVRDEARRVQKLAEAELAEAILAGGKVGRKASLALAKGLKDKNPKVRAEARRVERIVNQRLAATEGPAATAGGNAANAFISSVRRVFNSSGGVVLQVRTSDSTIGGRATGGPTKAGVPFWFNEDTPRTELFVPSTAGHVLTHADAMRAVASGEGGGGGGVSTTSVTVPVTGFLRAEGPADVARHLRNLANSGIVESRRQRSRVRVPNRGPA